MKASLYLIPVPISAKSPRVVLSGEVLQILQNIDVYVVENVKTARKYLHAAGIEINDDKLEFLVLDEHTSPKSLPPLLEPLQKGRNVGLMSEAGMPALADPGAGLILLSHHAGFRVIPLPGPSSIMLALVASGLNGQNFAFTGYLPVKRNQRIRAIKKLEERAYQEKQAQIFMETPYRNMAILDDLIRTCRSGTLLCIATNINSDKEHILTKTIGEWKEKRPDIHKKPSVFILGLSN